MIVKEECVTTEKGRYTLIINIQKKKISKVGILMIEKRMTEH